MCRGWAACLFAWLAGRDGGDQQGMFVCGVSVHAFLGNYTGGMPHVELHGEVFDAHHVRSRAARRLVRVLASFADGVLKSGSLSLEKRLGIDEKWEKLWGSTKVGAFAGLTLKNIVEFKLGLFGGFFQIDCFNVARVSAFVFGTQLDLVYAKVGTCLRLCCLVLLCWCTVGEQSAPPGLTVRTSHGVGTRVFSYVVCPQPSTPVLSSRRPSRLICWPASKRLETTS